MHILNPSQPPFLHFHPPTSPPAAESQAHRRHHRTLAASRDPLPKWAAPCRSPPAASTPLLCSPSCAAASATCALTTPRRPSTRSSPLSGRCAASPSSPPPPATLPRCHPLRGGRCRRHLHLPRCAPRGDGAHGAHAPGRHVVTPRRHVL
jgi:hypothetical protein